MLSLRVFLALFQKGLIYVFYVCFYRGFNEEEKITEPQLHVNACT